MTLKTFRLFEDSESTKPFLGKKYPEIYAGFVEVYPEWIIPDEYGDDEVCIAENEEDIQKFAKKAGRLGGVNTNNSVDIADNYILFEPEYPEWNLPSLIIPRHLKDEAFKIIGTENSSKERTRLNKILNVLSSRRIKEIKLNEDTYYALLRYLNNYVDYLKTVDDLTAQNLNKHITKFIENTKDI